MHEDKPVGYEAARWMIETELEGLYKICNPPEIAAGIYEYYLRAYLNPNHMPTGARQPWICWRRTCRT